MTKHDCWITTMYCRNWVYFPITRQPVMLCGLWNLQELTRALQYEHTTSNVSSTNETLKLITALHGLTNESVFCATYATVPQCSASLRFLSRGHLYPSESIPSLPFEIEVHVPPKRHSQQSYYSSRRTFTNVAEYVVAHRGACYTRI